MSSTVFPGAGLGGSRQRWHGDERHNRHDAGYYARFMMMVLYDEVGRSAAEMGLPAKPVHDAATASSSTCDVSSR